MSKNVWFGAVSSCIIVSHRIGKMLAFLQLDIRPLHNQTLFYKANYTFAIAVLSLLLGSKWHRGLLSQSLQPQLLDIIWKLKQK